MLALRARTIAYRWHARVRYTYLRAREYPLHVRLHKKLMLRAIVAMSQSLQQYGFVKRPRVLNTPDSTGIIYNNYYIQVSVLLILTLQALIPNLPLHLSLQQMLQFNKVDQPYTQSCPQASRFKAHQAFSPRIALILVDTAPMICTKSIMIRSTGFFKILLDLPLSSNFQESRNITSSEAFSTVG